MDDSFLMAYNASPEDYDYYNGNMTGNGTPIGTLEYLFVSVVLVISILIIFANSLVLAAVFKFPNLRTVTNVQIVNLSCADLFLGVSMLVYAISMFIMTQVPMTSVLSCINHLIYVCMIFATTSSGFFLLSISIDRFIAIVYPYKYRTMMSKRRIAVACVFIWTYSLLWVVFPFFGREQWIDYSTCKIMSQTVSRVNTIMFIIHTMLTIVILSILYCKMYFIAAKISNDTRNLKLLMLRKESVDSAISDRCDGMWDASKHYSSFTFTRNIRAAKTVGLIVGIYTICVTPFLLISLVEELQISAEWLDICQLITLFLLTLNSAINPLIYHLRNSEFRIAFKRILHRKV